MVKIHTNPSNFLVAFIPSAYHVIPDNNGNFNDGDIYSEQIMIDQFALYERIKKLTTSQTSNA